MRDIRSGNLGILVAAVLLFTIQSFADSHARIVRLSDVEGSVQVDRNTGQGFEKAILNLPMMQGVMLRTNDDARAEVEFEDGTTLRLGSNTTVHFDELSLADSGVKNSVVTVNGGVVYVDYTGKADNSFSLNFAKQTTKLTERAHLRLEMDDKEAALAVFSGQVDIHHYVLANDTSVAFKDVFVGKNQTADFDLQKQGEYQLVKDIAPDVFDDWDKSQEKYHDRYAKSAYQSLPNAYGISDLNYYGSFTTIPGYGLVWQPFLSGAGWDPYANGAWAWVPGIGYMWVSADPWGWMPFYYGSWNYLDSFGWFWNPSGTGQYWNSTPVIATAPATFTFPRPPARPPVVGGGRSLFVINRRPLQVMQTPNRIVLRNGTAGLGIPRGGVHNFNKVNTQAQREGFVSTKVHTTPMPILMPSINPVTGQLALRPGQPAGQSSFRPASNGSSISAMRGANGSSISAMRGNAGAHSFPSSAPARSPSSMGGGSSSGSSMRSGGSFGGGSMNSGSMNTGSMHSSSSSAPSGSGSRTK